MPNIIKATPSILYIVTALFSMQLRAEPNFDLSGFSRVVAGVLDDKNASYVGYDNNISLGENSLLAVQIEGHLTDSWSVTTQLLAHSSDKRDSGIEWLYATYQATDAWQFKAGRLRSPFFNYSDFIDVGYAYPWITPPQQIYNGFLFDSYEGASASYELVEDEFSANVEVFWGNLQDEMTVGDRTVSADIRQYNGIVLSFQFDNLKLRLSTHQANANIELPEISGFAGALQQAGYPSMATSLTTRGNVKAYQVSLNYDALDYFIKSEIVKISSPILVFPQPNSYYVSAGYIFYPLTLHATFSSSHVSYKEVQSVIPLGLAPQLDALSAGFDALYNSLPRDNLDSFTLGLRWDFRPGMAIKTDISHLVGKKNQRSFFTINNPTTFDYKANLLQVAWEWVF